MMLGPMVLATKNQGKIREIEAILSDLPFNILSLNNYLHIPDVVEDGLTFFDNAFKKAKTISEQTNLMALADDSGLEVAYLNGKPGIYSSRYAGENATDAENISKLLSTLRGVPPDERSAMFRCVIVLYGPGGKCQTFEGRWAGHITEMPIGKSGFGYDPVFFIKELGMTVAELPQAEKNRLSHRAQALNELKKYLQQNKEVF
jgi:XTP/dITP diphosphohydrolase